MLGQDVVPEGNANAEKPEQKFIDKLFSMKSPPSHTKNENLEKLLFQPHADTFIYFKPFLFQPHTDTFTYFKQFLLPRDENKTKPVWWSGFYVEYKNKKTNKFIHNESLKNFTKNCIGEKYYTTQDCLLYEDDFMQNHIDVLDKKSNCGDPCENWGFAIEISRAFTTNALENLSENTINYICNIPIEEFQNKLFYTHELPLIIKYFNSRPFTLIIHDLNEPKHSEYRYGKAKRDNNLTKDYLSTLFSNDINITSETVDSSCYISAEDRSVADKIKFFDDGHKYNYTKFTCNFNISEGGKKIKKHNKKLTRKDKKNTRKDKIKKQKNKKKTLNNIKRKIKKTKKNKKNKKNKKK